MKPCPEHALAIPPSLGEVGNWQDTYQKKTGRKPYECPVCGYLIFAGKPEEKKLRDLKGSVKNTELEKYLVEDYLKS